LLSFDTVLAYDLLYLQDSSFNSIPSLNNFTLFSDTYGGNMDLRRLPSSNTFDSTSLTGLNSFLSPFPTKNLPLLSVCSVSLYNFTRTLVIPKIFIDLKSVGRCSSLVVANETWPTMEVLSASSRFKLLYNPVFNEANIFRQYCGFYDYFVSCPIDAELLGSYIYLYSSICPPSAGYFPSSDIIYLLDKLNDTFLILYF